jgi:hypothetical protein
MSLYTLLRESHSGLRYIVLLLLVLAFLAAIRGMLSGAPYSEGTRKLSLFALISTHLQLVLGLLLYFVSPLVQFDKASLSDKLIRYWTMEHIVMMILAVALITIGYSRSKKALTPSAKHRSIFLFFGMGLLVIVFAIIMSQRPFFGMSY